MKISVVSGDISKIKCDAIVTGHFEGATKLQALAALIDKAAGGMISKLLETGEITGKKGSATLIHTAGNSASHVVVIGLGIKEDYTLDETRMAAAAAIKALKKIKAKKVATTLHEILPQHAGAYETARSVCESSLIADHEFKNYKSDEEEAPGQTEDLLLYETGSKNTKKIGAAASLAMTICKAVNEARDLINMPSNKLTPSVFASLAKKVAQRAGLKIQVLGEKEIKAGGMEAIWAIAKGSDEEPKVVVLEYTGGNKSSKPVGLIGKGITFDSGGISLKPPKKMDEMKTDMAGAAAVLGIMDIVASLKLKKNIVAVIPLTENMPSGKALKPGDIVTTLSGKTVEIISTDAEGRMILADALTFAVKKGADRLIDLATLTGACISALGDEASGILGTDQKFVEDVVKAGSESGERLWQLPLYKEYKEYLKSTIADIKNCSDLGKAGTATGAIFLKEFAGDTPWIHIDIAGTAYIDRDVRHYQRGATGAGVFSVVNYLLNT